MNIRLSIPLILAIMLLAFPARPALAESGDAEAAMLGSAAKKQPKTAAPLLHAVEDILAATADDGASPSAQSLAELAESVLTGTGKERTLDDLRGANGVALRETVRAPLTRILEYAYNPDIPSYLMLPSVVRLSGWYPDSDILNQDKPLCEQLPAPDAPLVLHGREFEEITPDLFSGGYYRYDMKRLLVLYKHKGRNVFVSVALQDGPSEVGRKGVVLDDGKWEYFYSGIEGLTKGGIGWMSTYMYEAMSVAVYVENPDGTTTNTVYKWLRAGWAGMNVVRPKHILAGCRRYAQAFRTVIESRLLPAANQLAAKAREFWDLSEQELDRRIRNYARSMEQLFKQYPDSGAESFAKLVKDGGYAKVLDTREERVSTLLLEYLKDKLGSPSLLRG
ncbi:hypothetical protein [Desulfocurvus sp. DL9XJH121]